MEFVPWVSVEALCCGYWEFHSRLSSCSHFSCITDNLVAFGGCRKGGPLLFASTHQIPRGWLNFWALTIAHFC
jgi:hypothetical protein